MRNVGDYFYYSADEENQTLSITGVKGEWYVQENQTITIDDRYLLNGEEYRVTAIGDCAFDSVGSDGVLMCVELPAGIEVIGQWAFAENPYMDCLDLYRCIHLKEIKESAFAYCDHLCDIIIPASVESIHSNTVEESIVYQSDENLVIYVVYVESDSAKEQWGLYWNYLDDNTIAETIYMQGGR